MGMWLKIFTDGQPEYGTDEDIAKGKASWSRGRLDNIREVRIANQYMLCSLAVPKTSWHQFDRYLTAVMVGQEVKPTRIYQVIQAEIKPHHIGHSLISIRTGKAFHWAIVPELHKSLNAGIFDKIIIDTDVGKWITVVLPRNAYPSTRFSVRGKIDDD